MKPIARLTALIAIVMLTLPGSVHAQNDEQSIAVLVNDEPITNYDITQRVRLLSVTRRMQPTEQLRKKVIEELISERIQIQAATKASVATNKDDIERVFSNVAKSNKMTGEQLEASLAQLGVNASTMKEQIRARIAWRETVRQKFRGQVSVNASQVDAALTYDESADTQGKQTEFQLQRVRLEVSDDSDQRSIANRLIEADQLRNKVRSCTNLEDAIKPYRKASIRAIGRRSASQLPQPTRAVLMAADEGQATPATITSAGIEMYIVCAKRLVVRNDEQRNKVRSKLMSEEYDILARRYLRDLRQDAYVEYR